MIDKYKYSAPFNFEQWLAKNEHSFDPPICVKSLWEGSDFLVSVVGGPNRRTDFHDDPLEELFYQIKGNASLVICEDGRYDRVELKEGSVYLMPPHVLHSPQRPEKDSLCLLVERHRHGVMEALQWTCANCTHVIKRYEVQVEDLGRDLADVSKRFYATSDAERTCENCGVVHPGEDWHTWHDMLDKVHKV